MGIENLKDPRDGKEYKTIVIGSLTWFAENLAFKSEKSKAPDNKDALVQKFGRLYTLEDAIKSCPKGFRIPTDADWQDLVKACGGEKIAGAKLMLKEGWSGRNMVASNASGFSAMGAGLCSERGEFNDFGFFAHFWSTTPHMFDDYVSYYVFSNDQSVTRHPKDKANALSVRCVKTK